jgi:small subunit ribosomal protein S6
LSLSQANRLKEALRRADIDRKGCCTMPLYEHVFLARQDISAQQVESMTEGFQNIIAGAGGSIGKSEYWGLKSLTYKIKKNRKAHFTLFNIDAPHEAVAEMERQMRISSDVIRFLTIRVDEHDTDPSPMMKRGDRDDRRGGRRDRGRPPRQAEAADDKAKSESRSETSEEKKTSGEGDDK